MKFAWPLFCLVLAAAMPAAAQTPAAPSGNAAPPRTLMPLPKAALTPNGPGVPDLADEEDEDEPEMSLPLKDGTTLKGKLGSGWTFESLPYAADAPGNVADPKGRRFEMPGIRSERHVTLGGRKSNASGLSFGFNFDLPR